MSKRTFIEHVGNSSLSNMSVAAYQLDSDTVQLRAEAIGGVLINKPINVSNSEFQRLKSEWYCGEFDQSAVIVNRALAYLGVC